MVLDSFKGFVSYIVFYTAGVFDGCLFIYPDLFEEFGEYGVAFVYMLCHDLARSGQMEIALFVSSYEAFVFKNADGAAYGGLGISHVFADIYRSDIGRFLR